MNNRTAELLVELEEIVKANSDLVYVASAEKVQPLASETNKTAAYINLTNNVPRLIKNSTKLDGYDNHAFFIIVVNVDCTEDKLLVYDVVDSIQRSLLNDSGIWTKLIDRDIINIEYDNAEFYPKRSAVIAIEVTHRLVCV